MSEEEEEFNRNSISDSETSQKEKEKKKVKEVDVIVQEEKYNFADVKKKNIMERLHRANDMIEVNDLEGALTEFSKIIFYDKNIPEVYAERAEIYIKLCDFSSAISNFKKAISLKFVQEWDTKLSQLFFMKGLTLIEEGYCNDALNLVAQLNAQDVKFIYLRALAYIRAGNK